MTFESNRHPLAAIAVALAALCAAAAAQAQSFNAVAPTPAQVRPAVDQAYTQLMAAPQIQKLLEAVKADHERSIEDLKMLTEIEAPPFKEQKRAEAFLAGKTVTPAIAAEAAAIVAADITPVDDARGNADYRRHIVQVVARRSLGELFGLPQE